MRLPPGPQWSTSGRRRKPEGRPRNPWKFLNHVGFGITSEVAAGDAEIEGAGTDVDRDVLRAQEEELDAVVIVQDGEVLGIGPAPVATSVSTPTAASDSAPYWELHAA